MEELHLCLKTHSCRYKKMLFLTDLYSRYNAKLKENMENLVVCDGNVLDNNDDEDIGDADGMEFLDMEMEAYFEDNEEDFLLFEEHFNNYSIAHQRNILAIMEMLISRMSMTNTSVKNVGCSIYSKMKNFLKDYYERAEEFLERNKTLVEFQDNFEKGQSIKSFEKKYKQLRQLLLKITEKEVFVVEVMMQLRMI